MSTQSRDQLFDPGLQPERTELAWRRTVLTLAVGSLVALRLLPPVLGAWGLSAGVGGLVLTGALWVLAHRRTTRTKDALLHDGPMPGGSLLLTIAALTTVGAALGLLYVTLD